MSSILSQFPKSLPCHLTAPPREPHDREPERPFTYTNTLFVPYPNSCFSYLCKSFCPRGGCGNCLSLTRHEGENGINFQRVGTVPAVRGSFCGQGISHALTADTQVMTRRAGNQKLQISSQFMTTRTLFLRFEQGDLYAVDRWHGYRVVLCSPSLHLSSINTLDI